MYKKLNFVGMWQWACRKALQLYICT